MTDTTLTKQTGQPARRPAPPPAVTGAATGGYLRHIVAIAKRSLIKMVRTPEALIDVTLQPIIFLLRPLESRFMHQRLNRPCETERGLGIAAIGSAVNRHLKRCR